jgi:antitoxin PrlF
MDNSIIVSESTLTDRYQTTVPDPVRKALRLHKREKIRYTIQSNGSVLLSRVDEYENDPVLLRFLTFLADDMIKNPSLLQAVSSELVERVSTLVAGVDVDLDNPLSDEDD